MSKAEEGAKYLRWLIDQYWSLAYAEGMDGRTHDTIEGLAQNCSSAIDRAIREMVAMAQDK